VEPHFHPDSYGYRPGRSALDAVGVCRERCWKSDWVIDLDLRSFFDTVDHDLILKAVAAHTKERWVLLYVERWLQAPLDLGDDNLEARDRGTPQGSAISPVLANLYLHYTFDSWMAREFSDVPFERYADDVVVHTKSERQARFVLGEIEKRMADCHLELNADKTHIVYCKDSNRNGSHEHERFDFLGYTFRHRSARNGRGQRFRSFLPAVSDEAAKAIRRTIRKWRIHLWSGTPLTEIARKCNPIVRGWINYYGRFYPSQLRRSLWRIDTYLMRWAVRKFKRLNGSSKRGWQLLANVFVREPELFAHWQLVRASDRKVGAV
jgi:RNA-directed DNA polymerase